MRQWLDKLVTAVNSRVGEVEKFPVRHLPDVVSGADNTVGVDDVPGGGS